MDGAEIDNKSKDWNLRSVETLGISSHGDNFIVTNIMKQFNRLCQYNAVKRL